jgi:hypothetical protein
MSLHQSACRTKEVKSEYDGSSPRGQPLSALFAATIHQFSFHRVGHFEKSRREFTAIALKRADLPRFCRLFPLRRPLFISAEPPRNELAQEFLSAHLPVLAAVFRRSGVQ